MMMHSTTTLVRDIIRSGGFPSISAEGVEGVRLEDSFINHCSEADALSSKESFIEYLKSIDVTFTQDGKRYWVVTFSKNDSEDNPTYPETLRMPVVIGDYAEKHGQNANSNYDMAGFEDIIKGSNPTSLGVGIFCLDDENNLKCVGTSDIKTGADSAYEYDSAKSRHPIKGDYIRDHLNRYEKRPLNGQPLVYKLDNEAELEAFIKDFELDVNNSQILLENDDGNFEIDLPRIVVEKGLLPVHTLLVGDVKNIKNSPDFEIGQLAKSDDLNGAVAVMLSAGLLQIYEDLTRKDKRVSVGFSLSPHFIKQIFASSNERSLRLVGALLDARGFSEFKGKNIKDIIMEKISMLYKSIKLFPLKDSKFMIVRTKDRGIYIIPGIYQGETIEIPAYIDTETDDQN
jgi:hypothetical protein